MRDYVLNKHVTTHAIGQLYSYSHGPCNYMYEAPMNFTIFPFL